MHASDVRDFERKLKISQLLVGHVCMSPKNNIEGKMVMSLTSF